MRDLAGRTAFITGGASGIGFGMAQAFAQAGMNLVLADIDGEALERAATALMESGCAVLGVRLDVRDRGQWDAAVSQAEARFGAIHVLCNNAGIVAMGWGIDEIPPPMWNLGVDINLTGMFNGLRVLVPRMKRNENGGHIVNTGSVSSLRGRAHHAVYVATKHAVLGLSESLALELAPHGIGVSILCPGHVNTNLNATSHRQREAISDAASPLGPDQGMTRAGALDPLSVGEMVREAIQADAFYILPHPEYRGIVEERHRELMRAFDYWDRRSHAAS